MPKGLGNGRCLGLEHHCHIALRRQLQKPHLRAQEGRGTPRPLLNAGGTTEQQPKIPRRAPGGKLRGEEGSGEAPTCTLPSPTTISAVYAYCTSCSRACGSMSCSVTWVWRLSLISSGGNTPRKPPQRDCLPAGRGRRRAEREGECGKKKKKKFGELGGTAPRRGEEEERKTTCS